MRRQIVAEFHALREARDRLDRQTQELERSNTELEQFAYVASHDLQEPLRKVASFSQLLERRYKGQLDERADQYIAFAVDGAKRMQGLINDLLSFSRVGRLTREHVEVGARRRWSSRRWPTCRWRSRTTGATRRPRRSLPRVRGDAGAAGRRLPEPHRQRDQVPRRRAAADRDRAGRRRRPSGSSRVADNGIGIEPEYADRIFVIFQRLHPKDAYPGTGIGLAMCRKIVEYHGGRIWLDTSAPAGTTFRFTLPSSPPIRSARDDDRAPDEPTDPTAALPAIIDVLLVEDDPGDVLMTREAFEDHKLRNNLHVVNDGVEAVEFLRREGRVRGRAPARADPARPQPAQEGRPGGAAPRSRRTRSCGPSRWSC